MQMRKKYKYQWNFKIDFKSSRIKLNKIPGFSYLHVLFNAEDEINAEDEKSES